MIYQSHNAIKQLETDAVEALLTNGDAQERVWAAWEIALRMGKEALPGISLQAQKAPDTGTRRHMVVVLAGLGHDSALTALATLDPDESVRGTATQYLIRTADQSDPKKIELIIDILENDRSLIVKQSVLDHWRFDHQRIPIFMLLNCVGSDSEEVCNAAVKHVVNQFRVDDFSADQIITILAAPNVKESIDLILNWMRDAQSYAMIVLSAERIQPPQHLKILDYLVDQQLIFPWEVLKKLCQPKNPDTDKRLVKILKIEKKIDLLLWLASGMARAINLPQARTHAQFLEQRNASIFMDLAKAPFISLIKEMRPRKINHTEAGHFQTILNQFTYEMNCYGEYDDEDYGEDEYKDLEAFTKDMAYVCTCIKRWLQR